MSTVGNRVHVVSITTIFLIVFLNLSASSQVQIQSITEPAHGRWGSQFADNKDSQQYLKIDDEEDPCDLIFLGKEDRLTEHPNIFVTPTVMRNYTKFEVFTNGCNIPANRAYISYFDPNSQVTKMTIHRLSQMIPSVVHVEGNEGPSSDKTFSVPVQNFLYSSRATAGCFTNVFSTCPQGTSQTHSNVNPAVEEAYKGGTEQKNVNDQLGYPSGDTTYILPGSGGSSRMLQKGHLVPNANFDTPKARESTYIYFNAMPQWTSINIGNWKKLEAHLHDNYPGSRVFTGTSPTILQLPYKTTNKATNIFLAKDSNKPAYSQIPVPRYMWKALEGSTSFTVVMRNNPYNTTTDLNLPAECTQENCIDIGLSFGGGTIHEGQAFCCPFSTAVPWIQAIDPNLRV